MAQSSDPVKFDAEADWEDSTAADNTCPECGEQSIASYMDRYSSYEYCTNCDWSEEDESGPPTRQQITRTDRGREEA